MEITRCRRRRIFGAVLAFVLILAAAACGNESATAADDGVATLGDNAAASISNGADSSAGEDESDVEAPDDPEDAFRLFNECMSDAGIEFGEAIVIDGAEDRTTIEIDPADDAVTGIDPQAGSLEDFSIEDFEEANAQCNQHLANVDPFFDMSADEKAAFEDADLKFRQCMEDLGVEVPDFDDAAGGVVIQEFDEVEVDPQTGLPSFEDTEFEKFNEAATECQHHFDGIGGIGEEGS